MDKTYTIKVSYYQWQLIDELHKVMKAVVPMKVTMGAAAAIGAALVLDSVPDSKRKFLDNNPKGSILIATIQALKQKYNRNK